MVKVHWLLALWTIHEAESDPWRCPLIGNDTLQTVDMEDMTAL